MAKNYGNYVYKRVAPARHDNLRQLYIPQLQNVLNIPEDLDDNCGRIPHSNTTQPNQSGLNKLHVGNVPQGQNLPGFICAPFNLAQPSVGLPGGENIPNVGGLPHDENQLSNYFQNLPNVGCAAGAQSHPIVELPKNTPT